ncbi:MAG: CHC2 zinc finger domain-containing protein [Clostridia bacterium]
MTRKGKNFVGLCPFHEDGNPSLSVSRKTDIQVFFMRYSRKQYQLLQKYKNISYMEAVQELHSLQV